jgi:hypothetical protein
MPAFLDDEASSLDSTIRADVSIQFSVFRVKRNARCLVSAECLFSPLPFSFVDLCHRGISSEGNVAQSPSKEAKSSCGRFGKCKRVKARSNTLRCLLRPRLYFPLKFPPRIFCIFHGRHSAVRSCRDNRPPRKKSRSLKVTYKTKTILADPTRLFDARDF